MSIGERKQSIFNTIGALSSLHDENEIKRLKKTYSSIKTKSNDEIAFLLDILKQVVGGALLKQMIGGLLTDFFTKVETEMRTPLKKQFIQGNSNSPIPSSFTDGIRVPLKNIDPYSKFKIKTGTVADTLKFNAVPDFDTKVREAVLSQVPNIPYHNLLITFDQSTQSLIFKPDLSSATIGEWFANYIDTVSLINKQEVVTNVLDAIFGTITKSEDKSIDQILNELKAQQALNNLIDGNNDPLDLTRLANDANNIKNGTAEYDMGCGYIYSSSTTEFFSGATVNITTSTDPIFVGDTFESFITQDASNKSIIDDNASSVRDNFFTKIINMIKGKIINALVLSPQIIALRSISSTLSSGVTSTSDNILSEIDNSKQFIKCIAPVFISMMVDYIYVIVVSELSKLLTPIITKLVKEKTNQVKRIIRSLIPTKIIKI